MNPPSTHPPPQPSSIPPPTSTKLTPLDNRHHQSDHLRDPTYLVETLPSHPPFRPVMKSSVIHPSPPSYSNPYHPSDPHQTSYSLPSSLPHPPSKPPPNPSHHHRFQPARSLPQKHADHLQSSSLLSHINQPKPHHPRFHHPSPTPSRSSKQEQIPSMPLPMHPDPIQPFHSQDQSQDPQSNHHQQQQQTFSFSRHASFFDELPSEDPHHHVSSAIPPSSHPIPAHQEDQGNTLAGVDSITALPQVPAISNLSLPGISMPHPPVSIPHHAYVHSQPMPNTAMVGGASELADAIANSKTLAHLSSAPPSATLPNAPAAVQRRMRTLSRTRSQQMTESQRKQRHNEHTRASRSRIDRGLERLRSTIQKVQPDQKVSKKADVLQVAVKLLKEGYRLPATESDEERDEPPDSALSV